MAYNIEDINEADNRMKIPSIDHEPIEGTDTVLTSVIINQVPSQRIYGLNKPNSTMINVVNPTNGTLANFKPKCPNS